MSTITIKASRLAFVKSAGSSSWDASAASQGAYGASGKPRVGAILFPALRDVDWPRQQINSIALKLTFGASGSSRTKTIGLYRGVGTAISGTGSALRGAAIGQYVTADTAFGKPITNRFSPAEDAETFAGLCSWLQQDASTILALYMDETAGDGEYSRNYCKITAAELTIDYEIAGSGGKLAPETVDAGETVSLTISPMSAEGTVSHSVEWRMGHMSSGSIPLGAALTASYSVPAEWLYNIPNAASGPAECRLTTYIDGEERSTRSIPFNVTVPASIVPTLDAYIEPYGTTGGYYQHIGGATISATVYGAFGSAIDKVSISGTEGVSGNKNTLVIPSFDQAGAHEYTVTVTDTRDRTVSQTLTIDVAAYTPPTITAFSAQRYVATVDDTGATVYKASPMGELVWFTISAAIDLAGGNNAASAYILHGPEGAQQRVNLAWPSGIYALTTAEDRTILTARIPASESRSFRLIVADKHASVSASSRVDVSRAPMHISGTGYGAAYGGYSQADALNPELRSYWPVYGPDGYRMDATAAYHAFADTELGAAWQTRDGYTLIVSRIGALVQLEGVLETVSQIAAGTNSVPIATLPDWARPRTDQRHLMRPGSTLAAWECRIDPDGSVYFGRYGLGGETAALPAGRSVHIHVMWFAADAVRPVEQRVWITRYLTRCSLSNAAETAVVGMPYSATLAADDGYALSTIHVYMSGADVTAEVLSGTEISIPAVTGPVVIEAVATVGSGIIVTYNDGTVTITAAAGVVSYSYDEASGTVTITNIADMSVSYDDESGTVSIG